MATGLNRTLIARVVVTLFQDPQEPAASNAAARAALWCTADACAGALHGPRKRFGTAPDQKPAGLAPRCRGATWGAVNARKNNGGAGSNCGSHTQPYLKQTARMVSCMRPTDEVQGEPASTAGIAGGEGFSPSHIRSPTHAHGSTDQQPPAAPLSQARSRSRTKAGPAG
jgi:hypothetical protein